MLLSLTTGLATFISLLSSLVSAFTNPQVCYTGKGHIAPDYIVPCFTSYKTRHYTCCKVGNKCLKHNSCFDQATGNTYEYGCTDPEYGDAACPSKCGLDEKKSKWVGLVYCNGTNGLPDKTWICNHPDNCKRCKSVWDPRIEKLPDANCGDLQHDGQYVAFNEVGFISDLVPLPAQSDMADYFSKNSDRMSELTATTGSAGVTASPSVLDHFPTSSVATTATAAPRPSATPHRILTRPNHTKVMAVGLGAGIPVILGVVGFCFYFWRKHRNQRPQGAESDGSLGKNKGPGPNEDVGAWGYAQKAELPGDDRSIHEMQGSPSKISEMDGSATGGKRTPLQSPLVSPLLSQFSEAGDGREHRVSGIDYSSQPIHELPG